MRMPRGHFTMPNVFEIFFVLFAAICVPILSAIALIVLAVLKVWCAYSWWWLMIPIGVLIAWAVWVRINQ